jgi:hypothetical protein
MSSATHTKLLRDIASNVKNYLWQNIKTFTGRPEEGRRNGSNINFGRADE